MDDALRFDVVTLFPEMFEAVARYGVTARALESGRWTLACWNPRDFTDDAYHRVDDRPFGGGPGMVMMAEPLARAIEAARAASSEPAQVVLMSPQGARFDHATAVAWAAQPKRTILVCGRYEAIDERVVRTLVDREVSLGDVVLSGGELAAMAVIDAVVRLRPGVLGDDRSAMEESFAASTSGLLDCPHWTRPEVWRDLTVPAMLLSGHHANIARWRRERSLEVTARKRPDLIERARQARALDASDEAFLKHLQDPAGH